jgi:hypothetical protein
LPPMTACSTPPPWHSPAFGSEPMVLYFFSSEHFDMTRSRKMFRPEHSQNLRARKLLNLAKLSVNLDK